MQAAKKVSHKKAISKSVKLHQVILLGTKQIIFMSETHSVPVSVNYGLRLPGFKSYHFLTLADTSPPCFLD